MSMYRAYRTVGKGVMIPRKYGLLLANVNCLTGMNWMFSKNDLDDLFHQHWKPFTNGFQEPNALRGQYLHEQSISLYIQP